MSSADRNKLKEEVRAVIEGHCAGIDLDTPSHWAIDRIKDPITFFQHLPLLMPPGSILYAEGTSIAPEVTAFYVNNQARSAVPVARDTIFPAPGIYHLAFSALVAAGLGEFASVHPANEMFDHIKGYTGDSVIFSFHDAFAGTLRISEHVPEAIVAGFCRALQVSYRRENTQPRDPEQPRRLLERLEHPEQDGSAGKPWWRRLLRR